MSRTYTAGLAVLGLLSLVDVAGPLLTDGDHPPMGIALPGAVLGIASLLLIGYVVRGASRAVVPLLVLRALSAPTAAPAFVLSGVPVAARALAAAFVVLTVLGGWLVASTSTREVTVR